MLTRLQKENIVLEALENMKKAKSMVFVDYRGLTVSETRDLKKKLLGTQGVFQVIKKTLLLRILEKCKISVKEELLDGQIAVLFSQEDEVSSVKVLHDFVKNNKKMRILGGILDFVVIGADLVESLAKMPGKQEMLGKTVGTIQAPISSFVRVLGGNIRGLVTVLHAIQKTRQQSVP